MEFANIKSALEFKKSCPYCKSQLEIRSKKHVGKVMSPHVPEVMGNKLKFEMTSQGHPEPESISLDIKTGKVTRSVQGPNNFYGTYHCSIRLECMECYQYSHTLNLTFDIPNSKLIRCSLNNVAIKRIIGKYEYSMKACKSFNEIVLTKIKLYDDPYPESEENLDWKNVLPKDLVFPYVDIDLDNPDKTIERLNQLILFV